MILCSRTISFAVQHFPLFKQPWRCFGGLDTSPSSVMRNAEVQTIYTETLNISKQGRLEVRCPFNLYVTPINQKDFPRLDKAFFTIYGNETCSILAFFDFLEKKATVVFNSRKKLGTNCLNFRLRSVLKIEHFVFLVNLPNRVKKN